MKKLNFSVKIILFLNIFFLGLNRGQAQSVQPLPDQTQSAQPATTSTTPVDTSIQASFVNALSMATTPSAINAIVNTQTYNSVTYLVDYPSASNSIFSQIAGFFTNGVPNQTGQALVDLQTLLNNSNLNNFLSAAEQATVSSWLTNLTNASTATVPSTTPVPSDQVQTVQPATTLAAPVYTPPVDTSSVTAVATSAPVQPTTSISADQTQIVQPVTTVTAPGYTPPVDTSSTVGAPVYTPSAVTAQVATVSAYTTPAATAQVSTPATTVPVSITGASIPQSTTPPTSATVATGATSTAGQTATPVASTTTQTTGAQATTTQASTTPSAAILASFTAALSIATTPSELNTVVNTPTYNSVTYLVDYPSVSNGIFSKIAGFFPNGVTNQTGQAIIDLQTLLTNSSLNNFLSSAEQATVANWLTNLSNASSLAVKSMFTTALASASTPSTVNTVVNTQAYNSVNYLVDYPSASNSIFTKIQGFFNTKGVTNQTGQAVIDLQNLLSNPSLSNFLSASEQPMIANWLTSVSNSTSAAITQNQSTFTTALAKASTPSVINAIVNSYSPTTAGTSNSVAYLVDYPSATNSIFTKIQGFFNASGVPTQTGQALIDLQTLLNNTNLNNFLSSIEQQTVAIWLANVNTAVNSVSSSTTATSIDTTVQNAISSAMGNSAISSQVTALNSIVQKYNSATVAYETQVAFAAAIMSVGGNYLNTNFSALTSFYNTIKAKTTLTPTDKSSIKTTIAPYITSLGGNINNFMTLLTNSLKTNLLTGSVSTPGTQMNFINTTLIPAVNMLVYLNSKSS